MVHLVCDCLNVRIHAKVSSVSSVAMDSLNISNEAPGIQFFQNGVNSVVLDLAGITKEVPSLVKTNTNGEWTISTCLNCKHECFAVHVTQGLSRVLVSQRMKSDPTAINNLMQSEQYSPLYKIILHHQQASLMSNTLGLLDLHTRRSDVLESTLNNLQQSLTKFLMAEQEAMEERIRIFTERQKSSYSELQSRVRMDKHAISNILFESEEHELQDSLSEAMLDTTGLTPPMTPISNVNQSCDSPLMNSGEFRDQLNSEEQDQVINEIPKPKAIVRPRPQSFGRPLHGRLAVRKKASINAPKIAQSLDTDGIFDIDGVQEDLNTPFYHSDDDDVDLLSDGNSDDVFSPAPKDPYKQYPMSLPIDMPMWMSHHQDNDDSDDDGKEPLPDDPSQIAESIKALAQSIRQSDGTAMFGDLPRPRLNTLN